MTFFSRKRGIYTIFMPKIVLRDFSLYFNTIIKKKEAQKRVSFNYLTVRQIGICLFQTAFFIQFFNAWWFILYVSVYIIWKQFSSLFFYQAVRFCRFGIASEKISECNMTVQFFRVFRTYIQVMYLQMLFARILKRLSIVSFSLAASIAEINSFPSCSV